MLASFAARFLETFCLFSKEKSDSEPSWEVPQLGGLSFAFLSLIFFVDFLVFGACKKKKRKNEQETLAKKKKEKIMKRNASKRDECQNISFFCGVGAGSVTSRFGRSRHQSFRVCKVNLATLKVVINQACKLYFDVPHDSIACSSTSFVPFCC